MATPTTTNGTPRTNTTATPANTFGVFADCMTESVRAGFDMNRRVVDAWTKNWTAQPFGAEQVTARWTNFFNAMTAQTTRTMTEMTNLMVDQVKVGTTMTERLTRATAAAMNTVAPKAVPTETREIVTEAIDATARNTERFTRLGVTNFESVSTLLETVAAEPTTTR